MDRREEETRVWPRAGIEPPADDEEWPEAPLSLWTRLLNFFTVEVPDEPEADRPQIAARRARTAHGEVSEPAGAGPGDRRPTREGAPAGTRVWRRVARPYRPLPRRSLRSRPGSTLAARVRRHPWTAAVAAMAAIAAAAFLVTHAGQPHPPAIASQATRPAPHPPTHPAPAAASPAPAAKPALVAKGPSTPDCASMSMQPATSPGSSTSPSVPGLCFSLGGGSGWLIGCAPGFQAGCDPSLQIVIACVRQAGARHRGVVTEADVHACDAAAAGSATSAAAAAPTGPAPPG